MGHENLCLHPISATLENIPLQGGPCEILNRALRHIKT